MNEQEFHRRWANRAERYAGSTTMSEDLSIHILVDPGYAATYAGQVAALTAASPLRADEQVRGRGRAVSTDR